ncbi:MULTISPECIES: hypothetical protein [unclassified Thiocapsa]|uniref:hypothetical protein n=1 Tax=unclassified Thiocapsa TaxID=2641286 RepID=UPI0035B11F70
MIDVILEARRFAAETIRHLLQCGCSSGSVREVECELNGAAEILSRLGHDEAVAILSRVVTDLPSMPLVGFAGDREMCELYALLARLVEEIDKQREPLSM